MAKQHKEAYDLTETGHVTLSIQGRFIDENYSRMLLTHTNLPWVDVLALDAIQKGRTPDEDRVQVLRRKGLVEGRLPKDLRQRSTHRFRQITIG